jgi:hypothetical protein
VILHPGYPLVADSVKKQISPGITIDEEISRTLPGFSQKFEKVLFGCTYSKSPLERSAFFLHPDEQGNHAVIFADQKDFQSLRSSSISAGALFFKGNTPFRKLLKKPFPRKGKTERRIKVFLLSGEVLEMRPRRISEDVSDYFPRHHSSEKKSSQRETEKKQPKESFQGTSLFFLLPEGHGILRRGMFFRKILRRSFEKKFLLRGKSFSPPFRILSGRCFFPEETEKRGDFRTKRIQKGHERASYFPEARKGKKIPK